MSCMEIMCIHSFTLNSLSDIHAPSSLLLLSLQRLLNWDDTDPSPISNFNARLLSCAELTHYVLTVGLHRWQRSEMLSYRPTKAPSLNSNPRAFGCAPASLPYSTVASAHGSTLAMRALPLPQIQVWSFHLPLVSSFK